MFSISLAIADASSPDFGSDFNSPANLFMGNPGFGGGLNSATVCDPLVINRLCPVIRTVSIAADRFLTSSVAVMVSCAGFAISIYLVSLCLSTKSNGENIHIIRNKRNICILNRLLLAGNSRLSATMALVPVVSVTHLPRFSLRNALYSPRTQPPGGSR